MYVCWVSVGAPVSAAVLSGKLHLSRLKLFGLIPAGWELDSAGEEHLRKDIQMSGVLGPLLIKIKIVDFKNEVVIFQEKKS